MGRASTAVRIGTLEPDPALMGAGRPPAPHRAAPQRCTAAPPSDARSHHGCSATSSVASSRELLVLLVVSMAVFALFFYGPGRPRAGLLPRDPLHAAAARDHHHQPRARPAGGRAVRRVHEGHLRRQRLPGRRDHDQVRRALPRCLLQAAGERHRLPARAVPRDAVDRARRSRRSSCSSGSAAASSPPDEEARSPTRASSGVSLIINAIPYYLLALLAYLLLISKWGIFPESGYYPLFTEGPVAWVKGLILAWLVLGISSSTQYARFSRGSMIESMNEDYVRTARAKGLSERRVTSSTPCGRRSSPW